MKVINLIIAGITYKIVKYYDSNLDETRLALVEIAEDGEHVILDKPTGCELLQDIFKMHGVEETVKL